MAGEIRVDTTVLRNGANDAEAVSDAIGMALDASAAALAPNAFGLLCSPLLLPAYTIIQSAADLTMGAAADGIRRSAANLRVVANGLDEAEDLSVTDIARMAGRL
jgi:hypothetical protein